MLEAPFQPGAAAFPDGAPHIFRHEIAAPVLAQPDGQRNKTFQIGGGSEFFEKITVRQHKLDKVFQVITGFFRRHVAAIFLNATAKSNANPCLTLRVRRHCQTA
jgi:hypothetical protein